MPAQNLKLDENTDTSIKYEDLSAKEQKFVDEFPIDLNVTKAAIRAGYSAKSAHVTGSRVLKKAKHLIIERLAEIAGRIDLQAEDVVRGLMKIAFLNPKEFYNEDGNLKEVHELDDDVAFALAGLDVINKSYGREGNETEETVRKYRFVDKKGALELLGKYLAIFTDVLKLQSNQIKVTLSDD